MEIVIQMTLFKKIISISILIFIISGLNSCKKDTPKNWFKAGNKPENYGIGFDKSIVQNGKQSAFLMSDYATASEFGTLMQSFSADDYNGKKIKLSGFVKSENVTEWSGMWCRIDSNKNVGSRYFDNMKDRPIKETSDWKNYEIELDVPQNSYSISFGVLLVGSGKVWIDNLSLEIIGDSNKRFEETSISEKTIKQHLTPKNLDFEK